MIAAPWASFCIATYRRPAFLRDTLQAITRQTFPDFEIIVSDNDPEGSSQSVVETLNDERVRYFRHAENVGMVKNFNRALAQARGEFVVMICDDDTVYPDMLATLRTLAENHPGYGAYFGASEVNAINAEAARCYGMPLGKISALAPGLPLQAIRIFTAEQFPTAYFTHQVFPPVWWSAGIVKRQIAVEMGGVPDIGTGLMIDFAYLVQAGSHSGCVTVNQSLGYQTIHGMNYTLRNFAELDLALKNFYPLMISRLSHRDDWIKVRKCLDRFLGGFILGYSRILRRYGELRHMRSFSMSWALLKLIKPPYTRPVFWKYWLATQAPLLYTVYAQARANLSLLRVKRT
jgi:glycosyltransferase involved in cell wall biosynthesis